MNGDGVRADYDAGYRDAWEAAIREFEGLADFWTLSTGWVGPVALHDFRSKIAHLRTCTLPPVKGDQ